MNYQEQRQIAIRATRSQMKRLGFSSLQMTSGSIALRVIDDIAREDPDLIASKWWATASDNQIKLFYKEWKAQ